MVALPAPLSFLVTLMPKKLKNAIETRLPTVLHSKVLELEISCPGEAIQVLALDEFQSPGASSSLRVHNSWSGCTRTCIAAGKLSRGAPFEPWTMLRTGSAMLHITSPQKPSSPTARSAGTRYCVHASLH